MDKIVLIDGHSILNRAFYGVPELTSADGVHTNAIYGFLNILFKILEEENATHLAVAFDLPAPTFRHKSYSAYKGTRKPMPEELSVQVPLMKEVLIAMEVPILTLSGYEADDILGTVAKACQERGALVSIVSGDRDLLQLADTNILIRIPKTSRRVTQIHDYKPEDVKAEYGVTPKEFIDVKALMGDASDNIPGVPGIGQKSATEIIGKYGSIENALAHAADLKPRQQKNLTENFALARMSKDLATIRTDAPVQFDFEAARLGVLFTPKACELMKRLGFKSILARAESVMQNEDAREAAEEFLSVTQKPRAQALVSAAMGCPRLGLQLVYVPYGQVKGLFGEVSFRGNLVVALALSMSGGETACILASDEIGPAQLVEWARCLCEGMDGSRTCWTLGLKGLLEFVPLNESTRIYDASVAAYLLNPLKSDYAYDDIAGEFLDLSLPGRAELLAKKDPGKALMEGEEKAVRYFCYMAYTACLAGGVLPGRLKETGMESLFLEIEMPLIYCLYHMEEVGIKVEKDRLKEYAVTLEEGIARLTKEIYEECGRTFNINSPKQLGEILFEEMKLPGGKKTKTGYSTAADVLEKLAGDYPFIRKILDYRLLTKLNSTYAQGLSAFIGEDGRIHGRFNQTITATGRISSTEPNLQNIPVRMELGRQIRKVFVPREGSVFVDADYSQIELRILAHMSGDENLIEAYKSAQDIHAITASQVFHVPLDQVSPLQRRNAKAVNFGIVYGISAFGLSEDLSVSRKEATEYINRYFETYPGIRAFLDGLVRQGKKEGYVATLYGRRRPIPELKSSNFAQRQFGERVAMNSPIQGTAADIMKIAMIEVERELRRRGLASRIVLQIHDELLIETVKEEAAEVKEILVDKMKHAASLRVALEVEAKEGQSWFEAK